MLNHKVFGRPLFLLPVKVLWMMSFSRLLCGASFGHQNCATFWSSHLLTVFTYSTFLGIRYTFALWHRSSVCHLPMTLLRLTWGVKFSAIFLYHVD